MGQRGDSPKDEGLVDSCLRNSSGSNSRSFSGRFAPTTLATVFCGALCRGPWGMGGDWSVASSSFPKLESMSEWFTLLSSASLKSKGMSNEATRSTDTLLYQSLSPYKVTLTCTPYFYMRDGTADHTQIRLPYSCMGFSQGVLNKCCSHGTTLAT